MALAYFLKANNSSQDMRLYIDKHDDGNVSLTLTGCHHGNAIQIDFDNITAKDANDLALYLTARADGKPSV